MVTSKLVGEARVVGELFAELATSICMDIAEDVASNLNKLNIKIEEPILLSEMRQGQSLLLVAGGTSINQLKCYSKWSSSLDIKICLAPTPQCNFY